MIKTHDSCRLLKRSAGQHLWNNQLPFFLSPGGGRGQAVAVPMCQVFASAFKKQGFQIQEAVSLDERKSVWLLWFRGQNQNACRPILPFIVVALIINLVKMPQDRSAGRAITNCWLRLYMLVRVICQTAFTISQKGFPFRRVIKQIFELEYNAGLKRNFTGTTGQKCRHEQVPLLEVYFCIVLNFWRSTSSPSGTHRNPTSWHLNGLTGPMHSHTANSCFQHHAPYLGDVSDWCYLHLPQCRRWRPESIPGQACFFLSIIAVQYLSVRQLHLHRPAWWGGFGHGRRARWHGDSERVFQMGL